MLPERVFAKHWGHQVGNWTAWMSANQRAAGLGKEKPPRWAVCGGGDAWLVEQRPAAQRWQAGI